MKQIALLAALMSGMSFGGNRFRPLDGIKAAPRAPKNYPQPPCGTREEIAAFNAKVKTRQVLRRINRPWKSVATF